MSTCYIIRYTVYDKDTLNWVSFSENTRQLSGSTGDWTQGLVLNTKMWLWIHLRLENRLLQWQNINSLPNSRFDRILLAVCGQMHLSFCPQPYWVKDTCICSGDAVSLVCYIVAVNYGQLTFSRSQHIFSIRSLSLTLTILHWMLNKNRQNQTYLCWQLCWYITYNHDTFCIAPGPNIQEFSRSRMDLKMDKGCWTETLNY